MEKLVIIDSCMRPESRTRRILDAAKEVLSSRYDIESIDVNEVALLPLTPQSLAERSSGIVPKATVALARKIAAADRIIIAAPFWDMSFPSALKAFFENFRNSEYISERNVLHTIQNSFCDKDTKCWSKHI